MTPNRWQCEDCGHVHVAGCKGNVYVHGGLWCRLCVDRVGGLTRAVATGIGHMRKVTPWMFATETLPPYIPPPVPPLSTVERAWPPPAVPRPPRNKRDPLIEVICAWCRQPKMVRASQERVRQRFGYGGPFHRDCLSPFRIAQNRPARASSTA